MQNTILVYWLYTLTHDVWSIGKLGLFEAIPAIGFSMYSGHFADQREKKALIKGCHIAYLFLTAGYILLSSNAVQKTLSVTSTESLIYAGFFINGTIRAFISPANFSLLGLLLPKKLYPNGATWSSTSWQTGAVVGPLIGGLFIAWLGVSPAITVVMALQIFAFIAVNIIPKQEILKKQKEPVGKSLREGLKFVFSTQLILAVMALDMFAVLFGGATALLPAYAKDILKVGEIGYGWMRAAPGIGAIAMFFILAWMPLKRKPGIKLLLAIAGFGLTMIVFGISKNMYLSVVMLFLSGMLDAVSVVLRSTIFQLYTPDDMRGRVSALNTMFVSSSNEIGEVESGITAKWFGIIPAVIIGGCMTITIVGITYFVAPVLKRLKLEVKEEKK